MGSTLVAKRVTIAAMLIAILAAGCSSAPDPPERSVERRNRAAQLAAAGNGAFSRGDYAMALQYFQMALDENVAIDYLPGVAQSYNSIGRTFAAAGDAGQARRAFERALAIARRELIPAAEVQAQTNLGELALREGLMEQALELFEEAEVRRVAAELDADPVLLHNIGTLHARNNEFDRATDYLRRALELNTEVAAWTEMASNHYMLASIASRRENYEDARAHALAALDLDRRAEHSPGIAADLAALAEISERSGDFEEAYEYALRALRVSVTIDDAIAALDLLDDLERFANETGRSEEATQFARERAALEAGLVGEER